MSTKENPKNGDLFVYGDFSGMLVYAGGSWWQWNNSPKVHEISLLPIGPLVFIGNTDKILKRLKDES